jgi:DNA-binding CsgD family transcriptional regulator
MVGRDRELAALRAAAARARDGHTGLVLVLGEAGIGKTRLVSELADELDGALVAVSHGVAMSTGEVPFGVLAELLTNLLRIDPATLSAGERERLAPLLPGAAARVDRTVMLSTALHLLDRLSSDRLFVWVVDDLQWADAASRDLLGITLRTRPANRLLVVATVRSGGSLTPDEDAAASRLLASLVRVPAADTLRLGPLSPGEVRAQLAGLDATVDDAARSRVERLSGGIPFLVEELAAPDAVPVESAYLLGLPGTLDALDADARRLADAAAIGGDHLQVDLLAQVTGLSEVELDVAIRAGASAGVLVELPSHHELAFRHPLLREVVDASVPPAARRGWHRRWARVLEARREDMAAAPVAISIARHWSCTGDRLRTLETAARAAIAAGELELHEVETEMWDRVIELWDGRSALPGQEQFNAREVRRLRRAAIGHVDTDRYLAVLNDDLHAAEDDATRACLELGLVVQSGSAIATDAGQTQLAELERRARTGPRDLVLAIFLNNLSELYLDAGDIARARTLATESLEILEERGSVRDAVPARTALLYLDAVDGPPERAIGALEAMLARAHRDDVAVRRWAGSVLMVVKGMVGDANGANAAYESVASTLDARLDWPAFEFQLSVIMRSWIDTGRWEHAMTMRDRFRPNWEGHVVLSDLHAARLEILRDGLVADPQLWQGLPAQPGEALGVDQVSARLMSGLVHAVAHDLSAMRRTLAPVWAETDPRFSDHAILGFLWTAVRDFSRIEVDAALDRPDPDDRATASEHLATIARFADQMHRNGALGAAWAAELEAQLARFAGADATLLFDRAADGWRTVGHSYDAALCDLYAARGWLGRGDRHCARSRAGAALATAEELGSTPLRARAKDVLRRIRPSHRSPGPLTLRESDVLRLLAEGRTNRQIASELFISPKTAGIHVSRILTKLGAANRTEATVIGRRTGLVP